MLYLPMVNIHVFLSQDESFDLIFLNIKKKRRKALKFML